jgi:hypothetical protein
MSDQEDKDFICISMNKQENIQSNLINNQEMIIKDIEELKKNNQLLNDEINLLKEKLVFHNIYEYLKEKFNNFLNVSKERFHNCFKNNGTSKQEWLN